MVPSSQVRKVHFDTQDYGPQAITGLEPKHVPLLHQQQSKGSLEWENNQYVSGRHPRNSCGLGRGARSTSFSLLCTDSPKKPTGGGHRAPEKLGQAKDLIFPRQHPSGSYTYLRISTELPSLPYPIQTP